MTPEQRQRTIGWLSRFVIAAQDLRDLRDALHEIDPDVDLMMLDIQIRANESMVDDLREQLKEE